MVVLDTNIIIDHLRQSGGRDTLLIRIAARMPKEALALSVISVQELYEGRSTRDEDKERHLIATIAPLRLLSYTYEIAELAGTIARDRTQPIELADAAIAATALAHGASLCTLDKKDFRNINDMEFFELP